MMSSLEKSDGWVGLLLVGGLLYWAFIANDKSDAVPLIRTSPVEANATENMDSSLFAESPELSPPPRPVATRPSHNYDFVEDATYGYTAAVSEEDRKRGVAAGNVVLARFRGVYDGLYRIEIVDPAGRQLTANSCARPCKAIKTWSGGQLTMMGYTNESIIGAAFEDAFAGRLKEWKPPAPPPSTKPVAETTVAPQPACWQTATTEQLREGYCDDEENPSEGDAPNPATT